jgi:hypothetical protein
MVTRAPGAKILAVTSLALGITFRMVMLIPTLWARTEIAPIPAALAGRLAIAAFLAAAGPGGSAAFARSALAGRATTWAARGREFHSNYIAVAGPADKSGLAPSMSLPTPSDCVDKQPLFAIERGLTEGCPSG